MEPRKPDAERRSLVSLAHPDDQLLLEQALRTSQKSATSTSLRFRILGRDGKYHQLRCRVHLAPEAGAIYLVGTVEPAGADSPRVLSRLRQRANSSPSATAPPPASDFGQPARVLLADDNPVNVMVARRILQKLGYTVEVANNGQEAVAKALTGNFDVVFMDLHMPLLDGIEATVKIRKAQATVGTRTPIVALTAAAMAEDRKRAFDAGMDGYVTKPFKMEDLQQVMEPLLRKN